MKARARLLLLLLLTAPVSAKAEPLTAIRLFSRCYRQLVGADPDPAGALFVAVKAGTRTPVEACQALLARGRLDPVTNSLAEDSAVGRGILATMHGLHTSWFVSRDIVDGENAQRYALVRDLVDATTPAMFYTRALLNEEVEAREILTGPNLMAIRTDNDPATGRANGRLTMSDTVFTTARFAPQGELLGVKPSGTLAFDYLQGGETRTAQFGRNFGAGALGSTVYLHSVDSELKPADGGEEMPRLWARNVYADFLCRDLPLIRPEDATPFVRPDSPVAFRQSRDCVSCHATMDRAASVIRDFHYRPFGAPNNPGLGALEITRSAAELPAETVWPASPDPGYARRPPSGHVFYRDFRGALVDEKVSGVAAFAAALARHDDFYVCVAKRYYRYFTGVEVTLGDPVGAPAPSGPVKVQQDTVIRLGMELKSHQSLMELVKAIFETPAFQGDLGQ